MTIASDSQALAADILNHADASGFPKWKKGADLSSANALTLGSDGNAFDITGTTAITSISTRGVGAIILLHFDGALTLTHHSTNLVLPDGENITTAAGDVAVLHEYASADWRLVSYSRADAASGVLSVANGGTGAATLTDGGVLLGSGTSAVTAMSVLGDGVVVVGDNSGDPTTITAFTASDGTLKHEVGGVEADISGVTDGAVVIGTGTGSMGLEKDGTLRTSIGVGTGDSPQLTGIELGHASDTTIARSGSGDITIEGNAVYRAGGTDVPVADGGTGASSLTDGGVLLGSGTGAVTAMSVLSDGNVVVGDGSGDPVALAAFTDSTGQLKHERGGIETDISGIAKGGILAGSAAGTIAIKTVGSEDQVLTVDGSGGIGWEDPAAGGMASLAADTTPQLGGFLDANGNYMQTEKGGDISSASPLVIDTDGDYFNVTGTTNYAAMTVAADRQFTLQFDGALTMTHHATNLDLPGEANITTAAGDVGVFQSTGANTVQCISYTKADGTAVVAAAGGGITHASQWRLTTDFTGDQAPIASNLEEVDAPAGFGILGSSMTESSGVFTFPSTGYWLVRFDALYYYTSESYYTDSQIYVTTNDSDYNLATYGRSGTGGSDYGNPSSEFVVDVTDTSNVKVRFHVKTQDDTATCKGDTGYNYTYMTFIRLGDT